MTGFDLPTNYIEDPEALIRRTRAKLLHPVLKTKPDTQYI